MASYFIKGDRGPQGQDGNRIVTNFESAARTMWEINDEGYADFYDYFVYWLTTYVPNYGDGSPKFNDGDITLAANFALLSTVDIFASGTTCGRSYCSQCQGRSAFRQAGAGIIYTLDETEGTGFIITNYHVVSKYCTYNGLVHANVLYVNLFGTPDLFVPVKIIGGHEDYDIAVLEFLPNNAVTQYVPVGTTYGYVDYKVDEVTVTAKALLDQYLANDAIRPATLANGNVACTTTTNPILPRVASSVIAIGNPVGYKSNISAGVISRQYDSLTLPVLNEARKVGGVTMNVTTRVFRTTAPINPGNSGGGLFNGFGELVGIVQARMYWADRGQNYPIDNIAYAIPFDVAKRVADQVIEKYGYDEDLPIDAGGFGYAFKLTATSNAPVVTITYDDIDPTKIVDINIVTSEKVSVSVAGTPLQKGDVIKYVRLYDSTYSPGDPEASAITPPIAITNLFQFEEIMLDAWRSGTKVEVTYKRGAAADAKVML